MLIKNEQVKYLCWIASKEYYGLLSLTTKYFFRVNKGTK